MLVSGEVYPVSPAEFVPGKSLEHLDDIIPLLIVKRYIKVLVDNRLSMNTNWLTCEIALENDGSVVKLRRRLPKAWGNQRAELMPRPTSYIGHRRPRLYSARVLPHAAHWKANKGSRFSR